MARRFGESPSEFLLIARWLSALAGALAVFPLFGIAVRLMSPAAALPAALLYAVAPRSVKEAHFGVTDTLLVLWFTMALWSAFPDLEAPPEREHRYLILMTVFSAFSIATKYAGLLAAPPLLRAVVRRRREEERPLPCKQLVMASLCAGSFCLLTNLYVFLDFWRARREVISILKAL